MNQMFIKEGEPLSLSVISPLSYDSKLHREVLRTLKPYKGTAVVPSDIDFDATTGRFQGSNYYFICKYGMNYHKLTGFLPLTPAQDAMIVRDSLAGKEVPYDPKDGYTDFGWIVFQKPGSNPKTQKDLLDQFKVEAKNDHPGLTDLDPENPFAVIGLMTPKKNKKYENDFRLMINEFTQAYNHPILLKGAVNYKFKSDDSLLMQTGLPGEVGGWDRVLVLGDSGVLRFFRYGYSDLVALSGDLGFSDALGRVYFAKNFSIGNDSNFDLEIYAARLNQESLKIKQTLDAIVAKDLEKLTQAHIVLAHTILKR